MAPNELAPKILGNLRIMRHVVGRFPVPPHSANVVIARELVAALLTAVDMTTVNPIAERVGRRNSYVVNIAKMICQRIHAYSVGQIVDLPELLVFQCL